MTGPDEPVDMLQLQIAAETAVNDLAHRIISEMQLNANHQDFDSVLRSAMLEQLPTMYDQSLKTDRFMLSLAQGLVDSGQVEALQVVAQLNERMRSQSPVTLSNVEDYTSRHNASDEAHRSLDNESQATTDDDDESDRRPDPDVGQGNPIESELQELEAELDDVLSLYPDRHQWQVKYHPCIHSSNALTTSILMRIILKYDKLTDAIGTRGTFIKTGFCEIVMTKEMIENYLTWNDYVNAGEHRDMLDEALHRLEDQKNELDAYVQLWASFWDSIERGEARDSSAVISNFQRVDNHQRFLDELRDWVHIPLEAVQAQIGLRPPWIEWGTGGPADLPTTEDTEDDLMLALLPIKKKQKRRAPKKKKRKAPKENDEMRTEAEQKSTVNWAELDEDEDDDWIDKPISWQTQKVSSDNAQENKSLPCESAATQGGSKKKKHKKKKSKAQKAREAEEQQSDDEFDKTLKETTKELNLKEYEKAMKAKGVPKSTSR